MAFNNMYMWLIVLAFIGVLIFTMFPRRSTVEPSAAGTAEETTPIELEQGETLIEDTDDDEQFGMYEASLSNWLAHHPSNSSVERYTHRQRQQIHNVSSVNAAMPPALSGYIPYNEQARFQTPTPTMNPYFSNHIRTSNSEEEQ